MKIDSVVANGKLERDRFYMVNRGSEAECICLRKIIKTSGVLKTMFISALLFLTLTHFINQMKENESG